MKNAFTVASPPVSKVTVPILLSRDSSGCGTRTNPFVIALWGATGVGKSWLGNSLSAMGGGDDPFTESEAGGSCTKVASSALRRIEVPRTVCGTKALWFEIVDLMGNADTDGESTKAVDQAVLAMQRYKPHLICLVEADRNNPIANHSLKAMQMCVEGCWGQQNIMQVVNRVLPGKRGQSGAQQLRQEVMVKRKSKLEELLGCTVNMQIVVPLVVDPDDPKLVEPLQAILTAASMVVDRVTVEGMQTFSQKLSYAQKLNDNAISADNVAREAERSLLQQISKQEQDVNWYCNAKKAAYAAAGTTAAVSGFFAVWTFGLSLAAAAAAAAALVQCIKNGLEAEEKLGQLRADLVRKQTDLAGTLKEEKEKYGAWTRDLEKLEKIMQTSC